MGKWIVSFMILAFWPTMGTACLDTSLNGYYFFENVQKSFEKADFVARVRVVEFNPADYQETSYFGADGKERTRRDLSTAANVTVEVLDVVSGSLSIMLLKQDLLTHSCSGFFAGYRSASEFFVAGQIVGGRPLINEYRLDNGGLY
ncbi:MAG: hypothetical protein AAFW87_07375 [Pseudomonadota bacterium]